MNGLTKKIPWPKTILFAKMTWPEVQKAVESNSLALIVVGQTEEHGPHLPLDTDSLIGETVAKRAAEKLRDEGTPTVLLPTVWTGYTTVDLYAWPGTISIKPIHLVNILTDICESLVRIGFKKIALINCHGGNAFAMEVASREIRDRTSVAMCTIAPPQFIGAEQVLSTRDIHGGEGETSSYLAIAPEYVDMEKAPKEPLKYKGKKAMSAAAATKAYWWSSWSLEKRKSGIMGDATPATREKGERLLKLGVDAVVEMLKDYYNSPFVTPEEHGN